MRIVLAASGTRGDVLPMIALAKALQTAGHNVSLCASPNHSSLAAERGVALHPMGRDYQTFARQHAWRANANPMEFLQSVSSLLSKEVEAQFNALVPVVKHADLVIGGSVHLGAPSVAELFGVPYRYMFFCPQFLPSSEHPPWLLPWSSLPSWANRMSWEISQSAIDMVIKPLLNRQRGRLGLPAIDSVFRHIFGTHPILAADSALATVPSDVDLSVLQTGALIQPSQTRLPPDLEGFISDGEPPIYVGFGSAPDPEPSHTIDLIFESTWALGRRAVISGDCAQLNGLNVPPHCKIIPQLDHTLLFPRMAAVVHHGGAGTTAAAARAGVPQVVVPHLMDQHYWGWQIYTLGMGPRPIWRRHLTARRLTRALQETLASAETRLRSRSMASRLWSTDPVADTVKALMRGPWSRTNRKSEATAVARAV